MNTEAEHMPSATISFMGPIRRPPGVAAKTEVEIDEKSTVETLLTGLGYSVEDRSRLKILADGETLKLSDSVSGSRELTIFLPLGGG